MASDLQVTSERFGTRHAKSDLVMWPSLCTANTYLITDEVHFFLFSETYLPNQWNIFLHTILCVYLITQINKGYLSCHLWLCSFQRLLRGPCRTVSHTDSYFLSEKSIRVHFSLSHFDCDTTKLLPSATGGKKLHTRESSVAQEQQKQTGSDELVWKEHSIGRRETCSTGILFDLDDFRCSRDYWSTNPEMRSVADKTTPFWWPSKSRGAPQQARTANLSVHEGKDRWAYDAHCPVSLLCNISIFVRVHNTVWFGNKVVWLRRSICGHVASTRSTERTKCKFVLVAKARLLQHVWLCISSSKLHSPKISRTYELQTRAVDVIAVAQFFAYCCGPADLLSLLLRSRVSVQTVNAEQSTHTCCFKQKSFSTNSKHSWHER